MATDWAAISKAVQDFYDTNGWWPSGAEYDAILASLAAPKAPAAVSATLGTGSDTLVLKISQDAWQGSAQYTVKVDGVQIGGTQTASALHGTGQSDTITVKGNWAAGPHQVTVTFLNDAWGGTDATDRNLYIDSATYNGAALGGVATVLKGTGPASFGFTEAAAAVSGTPRTLTAGSGPDTLVLKVSQDAYQGDAQYTVKVDGVQVGGTFTAGASHAAGQADTLTLKGDWAAGAHQVTVTFLNDAWGGTDATDRNLYIDGATYNGAALGGVATVLKGTGPASFGFTEAGTAPGAPKTITAGSGSDTLVLKVSQDAYQGDAQYTVKVNGAQVGGTFIASASHAAGQSDTVTLRGEWSAAQHKVEVNFLNDAWGGTATTDRNLYVDGATFNGQAVPGAKLALMGAGTQSFTAADPQAPSEFAATVRFADEFNGTAVDPRKWPITYGGGVYGNGAFQWDKTEVSVSGGALHIGIDKQASGIWDVGGIATTPNQWNPGTAFTYGKVEIRAQVSQEVWGTGPVFLLWPIDGGWPPEVDILETPKGNGMFTNHWAGPNGQDQYHPTLFDVDLTQWHTYGLEWTPSRLTMTLDGKVVQTITEFVPHEAMSIGLQGHVGASWEEWYGGSPNGSGVNHVDIAVDFVRVYDYIG
jgi:hypothetical protein